MNIGFPAKMPDFFAIKPTLTTIQDARDLTDNEIKVFCKALMGKKEVRDPENRTPHSVFLFNPDKVSLDNIRAVKWNIDYVNNYFNADVKNNRICGRGITKPARQALEQYVREGYDIKFIDLNI